jgi:hypothetical protein
MKRLSIPFLLAAVLSAGRAPAQTDRPPVLTAPDHVQGVVGSAIDFEVKAISAEGAAVVVAVASLPPGASFDAEGGRFQWVPEENQVGDITVTFRAASDSYTVTKDVGIAVSAQSETGDPFLCAGSPLTDAQTLALFAPGTTLADLGSFQFSGHQRNCNKYTGCADWTPVDPKDLPNGHAVVQVGNQGRLQLVLVNLRCAGNEGGYGETCWAPAFSDLQPQARGWNASSETAELHNGSFGGTYGFEKVIDYQWGGSGGEYPTMGTYLIADQPSAPMSGELHSGCLQARAAQKSPPKSDGSYTEEEVYFAQPIR